MEAAVFDKNFRGVLPADDDSGEINAGDIAFERFRIDRRLAGFGIEANSLPFEELVIRVIAGHGEDLHGRYAAFPIAIAKPDLTRLEARDAGVEQGANFPGEDAVFDVGAHPVLERLSKLGAAVDESDAGAGAEEVERNFGCGILGADDDHVLVPVGMRLGEIVGDVREIFTGDANEVWTIVVAGGENDFFCAVLVRRADIVAGADDEDAVVAADRLDCLVEANGNFVMFDGAAIVFQRLDARGLASGDGHGQVANFHALGRGEKGHVDRIVEERVAKAALIDHQRAHARALGFDGAGEAGRAGADADDVVVVSHRASLLSLPRRFQPGPWRFERHGSLAK